MPLVPAQQMLQTAREKGYCIAGFDVFNLELLEAVLRTCERLRSPVMIQTTFINFDFYTKEYLCGAILNALESTTISTAFHLDHGAREMPFDLISDCLKLGFTSVMADASHLPLQDNINLMRKVVSAARPFGTAVEGELGQVSRNPADSHEEIEAMMTDPDEAREFVKRTQIDSLAVSVGSISGCFDTKKIQVDISRLKRISQEVSVPLVLHGGTGIPDEQIRQAISLGVAKVNVAHGLRKTFGDVLRTGLGTGPDYIDPRPILANAVQAMETYVQRKLELFGSVGKDT